jgi:hypothetical protein
LGREIAGKPTLINENKKEKNVLVGEPKTERKLGPIPERNAEYLF